MKRMILWILLTTIIVYSQNSDFSNSIIKIHVTSKPWDYDQPWQKAANFQTSGTGFVINNKKILTNAHVVADYIYVQVQFAGKSKKYTANVEFVNDVSDLAILNIDDEDYLNKANALEIGELPELSEEIMVYGFPVGGEEMSITKGVISRMEYNYYSQTYSTLLAGQIDAAVNGGNSGGPIIKNNKVVGVIMQGLKEAENTNYFIPPIVINQFLKDVEDGRLDGIPTDLCYWMAMENKSLRDYHKMKSEQTGAIIFNILPKSPLKDIIFVDDIVLEIDDINVDNDGMINYRNNERVDATILINSKEVGDKIKFKILRDGEILTKEIILEKSIGQTELIKIPEYNSPPSYYIIGGLVFQPVTANLMYIYETDWEIDKYMSESFYKDLDDIVILEDIIPHEINEGYNGYLQVIKKVNGQNITSMKSLISAFEENDGKYHIIETEEHGKIILERDKVEKANNVILEMHGITKDRSPDLE